MKKLFILFLFIGLKSFAQHVPVIKVTDLEKRINTNSDTTYIVNFWATWCAPCVKELPDFDSINKVYADKKVKVILVTMDFKEDLQSKVVTFINDKHVKAEVNLLDETNGNYFIPKVSGSWSGALPATLIINNKNKTKLFFEKKLNFEFLKTQVESILNK
ncbi:MAG: TlpA disulfide reductase family protein [Bacteroidia bacterium]